MNEPTAPPTADAIRTANIFAAGVCLVVSARLSAYLSVLHERHAANPDADTDEAWALKDDDLAGVAWAVGAAGVLTGVEAGPRAVEVEAAHLELALPLPPFDTRQTTQDIDRGAVALLRKVVKLAEHRTTAGIDRRHLTGAAAVVNALLLCDTLGTDAADLGQWPWCHFDWTDGKGV